MIIIRVSANDFKSQVDNVLKMVENTIYGSMKDIAKDVAEDVAMRARIIFITESTKYRSMRKHSNLKPTTGKWISQVKVLPNENRTDIVRYDVVSNAPYTMWLERGRDAAFGLPYSNKGEKNYRKSKFRGYKMFETAIKETEKELPSIVERTLVRKFESGLFKI